MPVTYFARYLTFFKGQSQLGCDTEICCIIHYVCMCVSVQIVAYNIAINNIYTGTDSELDHELEPRPKSRMGHVGYAELSPSRKQKRTLVQTPTSGYIVGTDDAW